MWIGLCSIVLLSVVLPAAAITGNEIPEMEKYEHRSFEFVTDEPFIFDAVIQDFVLFGMKHNLSVQMTQNCSHYAKISLQKCRKTILYTNTEVRRRILVFQNDWIPYLLKVTRLTCTDNAQEDGSMSIRVESDSKTSCRFVFRNVAPFENPDIGHYETSWNIKQNASQLVAHMTQLDMDALAKSKNVSLTTNIDTPFKAFLSKCTFVAPHPLRFGDNITDMEDQVDLITRMSQLICPRDSSSSFNTFVVGKEAITGKISYHVVGAANPYYILVGKLAFLAAVAIAIIFTIIGISMTYNSCLNSNGMPDDDEAVFSDIEMTESSSVPNNKTSMLAV